jgi:cysteine synthase A
MYSNLIGKTPMIEISYSYKGKSGVIYAKAEYYNLTGSIKDRMARYITAKAIENDELKEGMPIIEATSGNTGIAFSAVGASIGHDVHIFMPDWMSKERIDTIKSYGAKIHLVTHEQGGFLGSIKMADDLAKEINGYRPNQFCNCDNVEAHYFTTGPEIVEQLSKYGKKVDMFVAGVGTGGTVMGVGKYLKKEVTGVTVHPLEPSNSPTLTTGYKVGKHRIQGISDEFIPDICNLKELDEIIQVDDGDSIIMAQNLAKDLGLGVGISSGANFLGAIILQEKYGFEKSIVTIFSDDSKKYLSTDYVKEEPVKEGFISTDVTLLSARVI